MDYKKQYDALVATRKRRTLKEGEYYEHHHIIPKCVGGTDTADNMVTLSAREHYIAHWLLTKMYPSEWKLMYAFYQMSKVNGRGRVVSSKQFERAKQYLSLGMKMRIQDPLYENPGRGDRSRLVASQRMNSDRNPMRGRPEKNHTARPHTVLFDDGSTKTYDYGKLGYLELGVSRSSWIEAVRSGLAIPKFRIKQITKHQ